MKRQLNTSWANRFLHLRTMLRTLTTVCILVAFTTQTTAQTYEKLWSRVRNFERQGQPKSAYTEIERIRQKAMAEGQAGQEITALLGGYVLRQEISPDSFFTDVLDLERRKSEQGLSPVQRAVYASVLGQLYATNSRRSQHDSEALNAHPDSVREWSQSQYDSAAVANLLLSVADIKMLAEAKAKDYVPFVTTGEDAVYFHGDLLNVIGRRAVDLLVERPQKDLTTPSADAISIINRMLAHYRATDNTEAELLVMLDSVRTADTRRPMPLHWNKMAGDTYERPFLSAYHTYESMLKQFAHLPLVCEVYLEMSQTAGLSPERSVALLEEALQRYPSYTRANTLRNRLNQLKQPQLSCTLEPVYTSADSIALYLNLRNLSRIQATLYKTRDSFSEQQMYNTRNKASYVRAHAVLTDRQEYMLPDRPDWQMCNDTLSAPPLNPGRYVLCLQATGGPRTKAGTKEMWITLNVSDLFLFTQQQPDGKVCCSVVQSRSGRPVKGAQVKLYNIDQNDNTLLETLVTDDTGRCLITDKRKGLRIQVASGEDKYLPELSLYNYGGNYVSKSSDKETTRRVAIFTDRDIFRPGQQVHISGICYREKGNSRQVIPNEKLEISLRSPLDKEISKQVVTTDEMGNFYTQMTLPSRALPGGYRILIGAQSQYIHVEEYKRPTFRVEFDTLPPHYAMGDTLTVTGRVFTFAEAPCRNARITGRYTIRMPYFRYYPGQNETNTLDTVYTDAQGRFRMKVFLPEKKEPHESGYNLNINVEALSVAGETQPGNLWVPVGRQYYTLHAEWEDTQERERPGNIRFALTSTSRKEVTGRVCYAFYPVTEKRVTDSPVLTAETESNRPTVVQGLDKLASGRYLLRATATVGTDTASYSRLVVLYSNTDKRPPVDTLFWAQCPVDSFHADQPAHIRIGSSSRDVYLYYRVFSSNRLIEDRIVTFSDSILDFRYTYKPEYGDGLFISAAMVKDGKLTTYYRSVYRKLPEPRLQLSWSTFRDKLKPGQQEEWRLKVLTPDGQPARASLMATLYDASLDQLASNKWFFFMQNQYNTLTAYWQSHNIRNGHYASLSFPLDYKPERALQFDMFDHSLMAGLAFHPYTRDKYYGTFYAIGKTKKAEKQVAEFAVITNHEVMVATAPQAVARSYKSNQSKNSVRIQGSEVQEEAADTGTGDMLDTDVPEGALRTNFNETAFFYPHLRTDANGEVSIAFTLPESLTTWNFKGLAHTADMMTGLLEGRTVASKDFMVQLHRPRFVRVGDEVWFTATLNNLTEQALKGKIRFEVFDPETEKVISSSKQSFKVEAMNETVARFSFRAPDDRDMLACRVVAQSGNFSDGEQYYVPVLSDKEWITETADVTVNGTGQHTVNLEQLFAGNAPEAVHRTLTVEYTSHPVWHAIQALPALDRPVHNDVLSLASAYYASCLAAHIASSTPRIQQVIGQWKADNGTAETLWSRLQQNDDLKAIVLSETPWVLQAEDEATRKEMLVTLFDVNAQQARQSELIDKLSGYQLNDGSFAWFPGMKQGSEYMTLRIMELLSRIGRLTDGKQQPPQHITDKAINYLKKQNALRVTDLRKAEAKGARITFPGENALRYMYTVLISGTRLNTSQQRDMDYLLDRLAKAVGETDNMQRSLAASVFQLAGRTAQARLFAVALEEHLTDTPDKGAFFDYAGGSFVTSDTKLNTHMAAMEALRLTRPENTGLLNQMRRWLLQQKRVQMWQTPDVSAGAIYTLLQGQTADLTQTGTDKLLLTFARNNGKRTTQIAVEPEERQRAEAGLGYIKRTYTRPEEWGQPVTLTVDRTANGDAWGAVYAQYLMPVDKVKAASTGLRIRREASTSTPKTGDKLTTRYVITADRDYEYVVLKAPHAACCEAAGQQSGARYMNGLNTYVAVHDASTDIFIEHLPKGTYVIETESYVDRTGVYGMGVATLQCLYAPEFGAHTETAQIQVKP